MGKQMSELSSEEQRALLAKLLRKKTSKLKRAPLSFAQERLWFLYQLDPDNTAHNTFNAVRLSGALDVKALERSFNQIVQRHEILRTTFSTIDGQAVQLIAPTLFVKLPLVDLQDLSGVEQETGVQQLAREEAQRPFDLSVGPLVRTTLLRLSETRHVLLLAIHHIVSDSWSVGVLLHELMTLYQMDSRGSDLPALPLQYADFAVWQREWLQGQVLETQRSYWQQQLKNMTALQLPSDRARPGMSSYAGATYSWRLGPALTRELKSLSQREGLSLFKVLLTGCVSVLHRYSGQADITVRSPVANRTRKELEGLIGYFVNTLALRTDLSGNPTFRELAHRVSDVCHGAYTHQDIPFEKALEDVQLAPRQGGALFPVMFILQNAPLPLPDVPGLQMESLDLDDGLAPFELTIALREMEGGLRGRLNYSTDLFEAASIQRLAEHLQSILESAVADPEQRLAALAEQVPVEQIPVVRLQSRQETEYVAPRTPSEETLAGIWAKMLGVTRVGIHDNFFELGGDSLLVLQVISKAKQAGLSLAPRQLFQFQTIAELSQVVMPERPPITIADEEINTGEVLFTHNQARFIQQDFPAPHWWNITRFFKLDRALGYPVNLEQAVRQVIMHHDALRLRFVIGETGWKQFLIPPDNVTDSFLTTVDLSETLLKEREIVMMQRAAEFQKSLNLTDGPTLRLVIFDLGERKPYYLLVIVHHMVTDGLSFRIIMEDIFTAYQQLNRAEQVQLPPKTTSLKKWAETLHSYAQSTGFQQQVEQCLALPWDQAGALPVDYPGGREKNTMGSHDTERMSLNPEETEILLKKLPRLYNAQPFEVLLMALVQSISHWTGRPWVSVSMIDTGRTMDIPGSENLDLARTVGWLSLHTLLLLQRCETDDPGKALKSIQNQLLSFPRQGFSEDIARLSPTYASDWPLPEHVNDLRLNYLGRNRQLTSDDLQPASMATGATSHPECHADWMLGCVVSILGKRLYCSWDYSRFCYEKATIKHVTEDCMGNIRALIAHSKTILS